jgi:hypothetical protein
METIARQIKIRGTESHIQISQHIGNTAYLIGANLARSTCSNKRLRPRRRNVFITQ